MDKMVDGLVKGEACYNVAMKCLGKSAILIMLGINVVWDVDVEAQGRSAMELLA